MSDNPQDHYALLGVDRAADERAVKKAYFQLVRQFPPETKPDEFRRLREAYETLSDTERRKAYDASSSFNEYGDQTGGRLTEAQHAMSRQDWARAAALLEPIVAERADLHVALDMLGQAYLYSQNPRAALERFEQAVALRPDIARYHLHHSFGLHANQRMDDAIATCQRALAQDPAERETYRVLTNFAQEAQRTHLAVETLKAAIDRFRDNFVDHFFLTLQLVGLEAGSLGPGHVVEGVKRLVAEVPPASDVDTRKYLAARLGGVAASLFAQRHADEANAVLDACRALRGDSKTRAFPNRIDAVVDELPTDKQELLLRVGQEAKAGTVVQSMRYSLWYRTAGLALLCVAATVVLLSLTFTPARTAGDAIALSWFLVGDALFVVYTARLVREFLSSQHDHLRFMHSVYFVIVNLNRIQAWPLFTLRNIQLTNHRVNGVYSHTAVEVTFVGTRHNFSFHGQQQATDWAKALDQKRVMALQMLAEGLLDEDPEAQFFPPEIVERSRNPHTAPQRRGRWRPYAMGAGIGVALAAVAVVVARTHDAERAMIATLARRGATPLVELLARDGSGGRGAIVRAELERRLTEARGRCEARLLPLAGSSEALCELVPRAAAEANSPLHISVSDSEATSSKAMPWPRVVGSALDQLAGPDIVHVEVSERDPAIVVDCRSEESLRRCAFTVHGTRFEHDERETRPGDADRAMRAAFLEHFGVAAEGQPALSFADPPGGKMTNPYKVASEP